MIRELIRTEGTSSDVDPFLESFLELSEIGPACELQAGNRTVVFMQAHNHLNVPYVIVPGFKHSDYYRNKNGVTCVEVRLIPKRRQEEIKKALRSRTQGEFAFWD